MICPCCFIAPVVGICAMLAFTSAGGMSRCSGLDVDCVLAVLSSSGCDALVASAGAGLVSLTTNAFVVVSLLGGVESPLSVTFGCGSSGLSIANAFAVDRFSAQKHNTEMAITFITLSVAIVRVPVQMKPSNFWFISNEFTQTVWTLEFSFVSDLFFRLSEHFRITQTKISDCALFTMIYILLDVDRSFSGKKMKINGETIRLADDVSC